ncbi:MAG: haloacid dehalogenase type II [Sedimenticola sp.]|uniref:(S)-2-haloacid dehalogenase n=1 Tax=Sedimenticola thiotaurini TaxID=1543721 RepID=A0A558DFW2_9GAMM|nr:haloacid dehalogenase type II [Sedimenticola sp.]MCW8946130.1 haloacid dehalogenase type II [Sedimenticola sp.]MCW8975951.1 haloacid dehalogenase type II [Sedimenticola sp.]MCW9021490.1 haloacid dehalogenase type II [Sedimenticola sp.]TVT59919.1 MAG: haloacid dehalogenase type II [Sedimenticola thiotaurini]
MPLTFAFDVYGTLIDTAGITQNLEQLVGSQAARFSSRWRDKQLEYSFRRGLMQDYVDFSVCTREALEFTATQLNLPIAEPDKKALLEAYRHLPAFADTKAALKRLNDAGHRLYAFSNGLPDDLESLLTSAGIRNEFLDIVSVHEIRTFKPNPAVYQHFLSRSGAAASRCWLVSSNPFDLLGGLKVGLQTAWIRRVDSNHFDPWGKTPALTLSSLTDLPTAVK